VDWYQKKNTPTVTSHIPLFFGGIFEQNVRVFEARKMERRMDFFVNDIKAFFDGINRLFHAHGT